MTQEEKDLVLRDLCARLPYGVICHIVDVQSEAEIDDILTTSTINNFDEWIVKPYLRPMSSMTEEEMEEMHNELSQTGAAKYKYNGISTPITHIGDFIPYEYMSRVIDWLNTHHFDFRGLIEKGLAISTKEFNPYKE